MKCKRCGSCLTCDGVHRKGLCKKCEADRQHSKYLKKIGKLSTRVWKNTIETCHSHASFHGGKCLSSHYINTKTKYEWECSCGNIWFASLPTTRDRWCPKCAKIARSLSKLKKYGDPNYNNRAKSEQTCLTKYGSKSNMGSREVALKNAKASNNSYTLYHWKTGEEIICRGSYEKNSIAYLNSNQINFIWQVPFLLSNGLTYIIDFLDITRNTYVEIKGWWRDDARAKYELWKQDNPELVIEVWDKPYLTNLDIIRKSKI